MKNNKLFISLLVMLIQAGAVFANSQIKVTAMSEFKTNYPTQKIDVRVAEDAKLGEYTLRSGDTMNCTIVDVEAPKRGKRNATFYVQANSFHTEDGNVTTLEQEYIGKYSKTILSAKELKNIDYGRVAKKAVLTVGNHFVKGISTGVAFVEGVAKNSEDNRLKSGFKNAYKESPLSYAEKGVDLDIKQGESFYLVFKEVDLKAEEPNYSYTENAD